jgi:hypothetical protein
MNGGDAGPGSELVVVLAAAVVAARQVGMRRPAVTRVTPVTPAPPSGPWVWVGRAEQMGARRSVQRRAYFSR